MVTVGTETLAQIGSYIGTSGFPTGNPLVNVTEISKFDSTYANQLYTLRGNVTQSVTPGKTTNVQYGITGMTVAVNDNNNHAIILTAALSTKRLRTG